MNFHDPADLRAIPPEDIRHMPGIDIFRAMLAGDLPAPPVSAISNQRIVAVEEGRITWEAIPPDNFINPMGGVHGGWVMTVMDSALACAVHSMLPAGKASTTIEVKINITRGPRPGVTYRCEGTALSVGRRVGTSEARMYDPEGKLVAHGSTSCLVIDV